MPPVRLKWGALQDHLNLPLLGPLAEAKDALPLTLLTLLMTELGKPYSATGLGNAMRDWCDQAELNHCSAHGLRKACAVFAAEAGATSQQKQGYFRLDHIESGRPLPPRRIEEKARHRRRKIPHNGTQGETLP